MNVGVVLLFPDFIVVISTAQMNNIQIHRFGNCEGESPVIDPAELNASPVWFAIKDLLLPGKPVTLTLSRTDDEKKISFEFSNDGTLYSSGNCVCRS